MKTIRMTNHALGYLKSRGFSLQEIEFTIKNADWIKINMNRYECRENFEFNALWNGKFYNTKQIRPIFVDEPNEIVVITVYTYYF